MSTKTRGRIGDSGCGGFLNPPTHPEHTYCVETFSGGRIDGFMSLSHAVECEWLDDLTREQAKLLLIEWQRPDIDSPEVQDWIHHILGYFKGCYKGQESSPGKGDEWYATNLRIDNSIPPMLNIDLHAGVRLIREYYPSFAPTTLHFAQAYWGKKPE